MERLNLFNTEDSTVFGDEECFEDMSRPGLNGGNDLLGEKSDHENEKTGGYRAGSANMFEAFSCSLTRG